MNEKIKAFAKWGKDRKETGSRGSGKFSVDGKRRQEEEVRFPR